MVPAQFSMFTESPVIAAKDLLKLTALADAVGLLFDLTIIPSPLGHAAHLGGVIAGILSRQFLLETNFFGISSLSRYKNQEWTAVP